MTEPNSSELCFLQNFYNIGWTFADFHYFDSLCQVFLGIYCCFFGNWSSLARAWAEFFCCDRIAFNSSNWKLRNGFEWILAGMSGTGPSKGWSWVCFFFCSLGTAAAPFGSSPIVQPGRGPIVNPALNPVAGVGGIGGIGVQSLYFSPIIITVDPTSQLWVPPGAEGQIVLVLKNDGLADFFLLSAVFDYNFFVQFEYPTSVARSFSSAPLSHGRKRRKSSPFRLVMKLFFQFRGV